MLQNGIEPVSSSLEVSFVPGTSIGGIVDTFKRSYPSNIISGILDWAYNDFCERRNIQIFMLDL